MEQNQQQPAASKVRRSHQQILECLREQRQGKLTVSAARLQRLSSKRRLLVYKHYGNLQGVTHVNCNAYARRKFYEARQTDKNRAEYALMLYSKLYGIESYC